jgi:hypothetical protein
MVALAQQNAGRRFGFANPLFYQSGGFTDIKPQSSQGTVLPAGGSRAGYTASADTAAAYDWHGPGNTIGTTVGYDNVTGLGVPNGTTFFNATKYPSSAAVNIGRQDTNWMAGYNPSGYLRAQQITVPQTSTIETISVYEGEGMMSGNYGFLGLYDASGPGGGPGKLLATTGNYNEFGSMWNTIQVQNPVSVSPGTYWIAFTAYGTVFGDAFYYTSTTGIVAYVSYPAPWPNPFGPLPATFPTGATFVTQQHAVYATFHP